MLVFRKRTPSGYGLRGSAGGRLKDEVIAQGGVLVQSRRLPIGDFAASDGYAGWGFDAEPDAPPRDLIDRDHDATANHDCLV
jgi:hypothetical protein